MPLLYTKQGHTGILTLSRPEARNCWGQDYAEGLIRHLDEAAEDDEVRSVILTGDEAGGAFSAGANLRDRNTHNTRSAEAFIKRVGRSRNFPSNLVSDFPKPVIAAVNGYAIGIGCIITFCPTMAARRGWPGSSGRGWRCGSRWAFRSRPRRPIASGSPSGWCRMTSSWRRRSR
jgi:enoyl-CoA hydratase/carnithine racemase